MITSEHSSDAQQVYDDNKYLWMLNHIILYISSVRDTQPDTGINNLAYNLMLYGASLYKGLNNDIFEINTRRIFLTKYFKGMLFYISTKERILFDKTFLVFISESAELFKN